MANGASRIFNVMQKAGVNTISHVVYATVTSLSPLTFKIDDKLPITSEFFILSDDIILERLQVGQKLVALTFDDGQKYFIEQAVDESIIKTLIIDNLESDSIIDSLSANQGRILGERTTQLETVRLPALEERVSKLETRMSTAESNIEDLQRRVGVLESKIL